MNRVAKIIILSVLMAGLVNSQDYSVVLHPDPIDRCLSFPGIQDKIVVRFDENPYYLRGDFNGDDSPDYAVAIRGKKTKRNGVLMCRDMGRPIILGADNPISPPFSDMPEDNFVAPYWQVFTKREIAVHKLHAKGEAIAMIWEDGVSLIYWNGTRYRWSSDK